MGRRLRVFINAALSSWSEQKRNEEFVSILTEEGFDYYLPQEKLPPNEEAPPEKVLDTNIHELQESDLVLSVLDKPGFGVAFELGYALAQKKPIIFFRTDLQDDLGKIGEGLWENGHYAIHKAESLDDLRRLLTEIRNSQTHHHAEP